MPTTSALKPAQVPAASQPTLDGITKNIGFTRNMMATFAASPIAFTAILSPASATAPPPRRRKCLPA
jgi:hypothetical protein